MEPTGRYEAAAVLIASGARLDLRNKRGFSVADFAHGPGPPEFLEQALEIEVARVRIWLRFSDGKGLEGAPGPPSSSLLLCLFCCLLITAKRVISRNQDLIHNPT